VDVKRADRQLNLPLEDDLTRDMAEAPHEDPVNSLTVNRPLTTVFGSRLPSRLLDIGPVGLIVLVGGFAIALKGATTLPLAVLVLGLETTAVALLLRHRAPLTVLVLVLVVAFGLD